MIDWLKSITLVQWVLFAVPLILLGTTIWAAETKRKTISNTMQDGATDWNFFPFLFGAWIGHLFFPDVPGKIIFWPYLLVPTGAYLILDVVNCKYYKLPRWTRYPGFHILIGIIAGMLLWGSRW
jgi:hypothetical protein